MSTAKLHVDVRAHSSAPPDAVFDVLIDTERWPEWTSFKGAAVLEEGTPERQGVGALREFRRGGRQRSVERVVAFERPGHFAYALVSGLPLRDYRADVRLTAAADGGTDISWQSRFAGRRPGTAWFYAAVLRAFIGRTATALAREAERRGVTPAN